MRRLLLSLPLLRRRRMARRLLVVRRRLPRFWWVAAGMVAVGVFVGGGLLYRGNEAAASGAASTVYDSDTDFAGGTSSSVITEGTGNAAVERLAGWQYRKAITIDHTKVAATATGFPVLVKLASDTDLAAGAQATGADILFTASDGTTKLSHEIEQYNGSTGELEAWVNVPSVSASSDTTIYMYYGNSSVSDQQDVQNVWDGNYRGVWHLNEDCGSAGCLPDSTANGNDATPYIDYSGSGIGSLYTASGQIAGAQAIDGANNTVRADSTGSQDIAGTNHLTISAWVKRATSTSGGTIVYHGTPGVGGYMLGVGETPCGTDQFKVTKFGVADICIGALPEDTNWHHVVEMGDSGGTYMYVDGALSGTSTDTGNWLSAAGDDLYFGSQDTTFWHGSIDEVRISAVSRDTNWIATTYASESSPATFFALGSQTTNGNIATSGSWESPVITLGNGSSWGDGSGDGSTAFAATFSQVSATQTLELQLRTGSSLTALGNAAYTTLTTVTSGTSLSRTKAQLEAAGVSAAKYAQLKVVFAQSGGTSPLLDLLAVYYYQPALPSGSFSGNAPPAGTAAYPSGLISKGVPALASTSATDPSQAADADNYENSYAGFWRASLPGWLAYNLSGVPADKLHYVDVAWFNDPTTSEYDHTIDSGVAYNNLSDYTIECAYQDSGTSTVPPDSAWEVLATVTGNTKHSRQQIVDMSGCNWLRLNISAGDGSAGNSDAAINMDVYAVDGPAMDDDWIFYGDSITQGDLSHAKVDTTGNMSQLINLANDTYFPLFEDGGIGGTTAAVGAAHITNAGDSDDWLALFPGRYVTLNYGTNDANGGCGGSAIDDFYDNYVRMVEAVIAAGKTPVVPYIPWAPSTNVQTCAGAPDGSGMNGRITALYAAYPQIIHGPDLWDLFYGQSALFADSLHPNTDGAVQLRQAWRNAMMQEVYARNIAAESNQGLPALHASGTRLLNAANQQVVLRGVNRSGTEYECIQGLGIFDGPSNQASIDAMKDWGINAVNVLLNEDCWLGLNGVASDYGSVTYQTAVIAYVQLLEANGIYPVVSLQWGAPGLDAADGQPAMTDADHATAFWKSVAQTFKDDHAVVLHLLEEPYPDANSNSAEAWRCWKDGGACDNIAYPVVGMQDLVDTVRAAGADNVIGLSGVRHGNSTTSFLANLPSDSDDNLLAMVSVYPASNVCGSVSCYDSDYAPVAAAMPFMASEFGASADGSVCTTTATEDLLDWLDARAAGYLAWTWDTWGSTCGDLSLITNYDGTAKSPNGTFYKAHLAAVLAAADNSGSSGGSSGSSGSSSSGANGSGGSTGAAGSNTSSGGSTGDSRKDQLDTGTTPETPGTGDETNGGDTATTPAPAASGGISPTVILIGGVVLTLVVAGGIFYFVVLRVRS